MFIRIKVVTNAANNQVLPQGEGMFKVTVTSAPEKGKANKKAMQLLAEYFNVGQSQICIVKGKYTAKKVIHILAK